MRLTKERLREIKEWNEEYDNQWSAVDDLLDEIGILYTELNDLRSDHVTRKNYCNNLEAERDTLNAELKGWKESGAACDRQYSKLLVKYYYLLSIIRRIAAYGPPQGEYQPSTACPFCDMGGAGYSSRGDGFHDDDCAIKDAQLILQGE